MAKVNDIKSLALRIRGEKAEVISYFEGHTLMRGFDAYTTGMYCLYLRYIGKDLRWHRNLVARYRSFYKMMERAVKLAKSNGINEEVYEE